MPRPYEVVYIFDSTLEDAAIADKLTRYHAMLGAGGTAPADLKVDLWGRRPAAAAAAAVEGSTVNAENPIVDPSAVESGVAAPVEGSTVDVENPIAPARRASAS